MLIACRWTQLHHLFPTFTSQAMRTSLVTELIAAFSEFLSGSSSSGCLSVSHVRHIAALQWCMQVCARADQHLLWWITASSQIWGR